MSESDWPQVQSIYKSGIDTNIATFETTVPTFEAWDKSHLSFCRLVAENSQMNVIGWAALSPVSGRCVYGGVAEVSVYLHPDAQGQGLGKLLLEKLIDESEQNGIWTLQAGIFAENKASVKLHTKMGFRQIGYREKIGKLHGVWKDTVLMERRSKVVGV